MRITGYTNGWTHMAGATVDLHVSSAYPTFRAALVRHLGQIHDPGDWLTKTEPVGTDLTAGADEREIASGSYMEAAIGAHDSDGIALSFALCPTALPGAGTTIIEFELGEEFLTVDADEAGVVTLAGPDGTAETTLRLRKGRWTEVMVALSGGRFSLGGDSTLLVDAASARGLILRIAGRTVDGALHGFLDGRITSPTVTLTDREGSTIARTVWDVSALPYQSMLVDPAGIATSVKLINCPARGVRSAAWNGETTDYHERPDLYDAVAFHRDDLADCGWPVSDSLRLPDDIAPGVYSIVLTSAKGETNWTDRASFDALPVFVVPITRTARVALVLPTFSYRAYANSIFYEDADPEVFRLKRETVSKPLHDYAVRHGLVSLYDRHPDGSGVHLASLRRPQTNMRADAVSQLQGFPHQFSADLAILEWLRRTGIEFDVLTDEVLHDRGAAVLDGYQVAITGSHPEYASPELLDAWAGHAAAGGNIMYLGGNGFYWSIGVDREDAAIIEVRRRDGVRTWTAPPGEAVHQTDGRPGGLWRNLGRPPNVLLGVGFAAAGFSGDGSYVVLVGAADLPLGDNLARELRALGRKRFGVAGLELDRFDPALGSHPDTMVIASVADVPDGYVPAVEDVAGIDAFLPDLARGLRTAVGGDIVLAPLAGGGTVFSAGSIRWTSSFTDPDDAASTTRITTAVLRDFLDGYRFPARDDGIGHE